MALAVIKHTPPATPSVSATPRFMLLSFWIAAPKASSSCLAPLAGGIHRFLIVRTLWLGRNHRLEIVGDLLAARPALEHRL